MLSFLFSNKIKDALRAGASVVDIRTVHEYDQGRMPGSVNIPLERIPYNVERINHMKRPIIICGSGDSRSGEAARFLKNNGLKEIHNGGNWERVMRMAKSVAKA